MALNTRRVPVEPSVAAALDLAAMARQFEAETLRAEADVVRLFEAGATRLVAQTGQLDLGQIDDERLFIEADGRIVADLTPDGGGGTRHLASPDELIEYFDPTDLFDDLSRTLTRAAPSREPATREEAAAQLGSLVERHRGRIRDDTDASAFLEAEILDDFGEAAQPFANALGGLLLIDGPDERATLEADGRFRATVVPNDEDGSWITLRTADELIEYYTPAELLDALAERLRAAFPGAVADPRTTAIQSLAELARACAERSRELERGFIERFESGAARLSAMLGDIAIVDDRTERLTLRASGHFAASVAVKGESDAWRSLDWPDELIEYYDPADMFADLAGVLEEAFDPGSRPA